MYDILILAHALDPITPRGRATVNLMATQFEKSGLKVGYQIGLGDRPEARLVINHVDLTLTPPDYLHFLQSYPIAVNGGLTDISKQIVCQGTLVRRGDGYRGPVIVKTKLNFGGMPERNKQLLQEHGSEDDYTWRTVPILDPGDYPIFPSSDLVTIDIWDNPNLVVQRVATEQDKDSGYYCLRSWYVLGDKGFHVVTMSHSPIVRGSNIIERKAVELDPVPRLQALRREMKVDYGRFDYVLANDDAVVFDVNRTPTSTPGAVERYQPQWCELALGINCYLG